ncbi:MAG: hypothetical protein IPL84_13400 [Chitinophagaceae bacterium]|nr:hypothetical protein [Chitinophagaceae bacterium]
MTNNKKIKVKIKSEIIKLDMTFEEAMKKALNTPLPKKKAAKKKAK